MTTIEIIALIVGGILVGFINTLAGGGSIISLSLLMVLGLPPHIANGTNRIGVIAHNLVATLSFRHQKVLDLKKGLYLSIPAMVGAFLGAVIAVKISEEVLKIAMGVIMLLMLFFVLTNTKKWLHGDESKLAGKIDLKQIIYFFFIGAYGGFIQVGVGYMMLFALIMGVGYNLVKANAVKVLIMLIYLSFSLVVYIWDDEINWTYGLVMTIGSMLGALIASRMAVKRGINFVRVVIVVVILLTAGHLFGLYDFQEIFRVLIENK
ncbi:MAG: sulfite exporter TauE/SafE family protein [Bacteroidetes bacterium]|nr:sulfite exporter TauE/SafE family protein [Bacteroidota bacterium]